MNARFWMSALCLGTVVILLAFTGGSDLAERKYLQEYRHLAIAEMEQHGIPASITLAQALVESDAGRSILAVRAHNHFGIKCKSWWTGGKYFYADDDRDEEGKLTASCFRFYASAEESFMDRSAFLRSSERYAALFDYRTDDYTSWAHGLQHCGYATDSRYALRLIEVIERFHLNKLDKVAEDPLR